MKKFEEREKELSEEFVNFMRESPSHFHAVDELSKKLQKASFVKISEQNVNEFSNLQPKGRYYFTRNQSTLFAFVVGGKYRRGNGISLIAAHTDSPVLKLKPISKTSKCGFHQLGVQCYGGGLWNTWFDRDLSIAGRVFLQQGQNYVSRLVKVPRPILRIPNLAIHLNREVNEKGFTFNSQTNLLPILSTEIKSELEKTTRGKESKEQTTEEKRHPPLFLELIANELKVENVEDIKHFELSLFDTQPACVGGLLNEFIFSRALDNLMMSFVATRSLIDSLDQKSIDDEPNIRLVALFDNEEVGSESYMGAASSMMKSTLQRIINGTHNEFEAAISKSFLISADMAHALHPNYSDKHEENHRPEIHKGLVIKENANQRYATSGVTGFILTELAKRNKIPVQNFVVRNDSACGSTIGPILATNSSLRTVDVGIPQFAMHSIREMCGTADIVHAVDLFLSFFKEFPQLDAKLIVD